MEGETVIRILASEDGKNFGIIDHVIADYGYASYTIPQRAVGKTLKAEILPVDIQSFFSSNMNPNLLYTK